MLRAPSSKLVGSASRERTFKSWRAVEAQHIVSTLRLTASDPVQQELLERILEENKPQLPDAAHKLHYLLATPFRYPPSQHGSRFRLWSDTGVLYSASHRRTACAEMGYWRCRFLRDSPGLTTIPAAAQTLFQLGATGHGLDLTQPPLKRWQALWTHLTSYTATQSLARQARALDKQWIAYQSVRDPESGLCYAVLNPNALRPRQPLARETWYLTVTPDTSIWQRDGERFVFTYNSDCVLPAQATA